MSMAEKVADWMVLGLVGTGTVAIDEGGKVEVSVEENYVWLDVTDREGGMASLKLARHESEAVIHALQQALAEVSE